MSKIVTISYEQAVAAVARKMGQDKFHRYMGGAMQPSSPAEVTGAAFAIAAIYGYDVPVTRTDVDNAIEDEFERLRDEQRESLAASTALLSRNER